MSWGDKFPVHVVATPRGRGHYLLHNPYDMTFLRPRSDDTSRHCGHHFHSFLSSINNPLNEHERPRLIKQDLQDDGAIYCLYFSEGACRMDANRLTLILIGPAKIIGVPFCTAHSFKMSQLFNNLSTIFGHSSSSIYEIFLEYGKDEAEFFC